MGPPDPELTPALEAALVRELRAAWHQLNGSHFRSALSAPTFELVSSRATLGRWIPGTRTLEISRALVLERAWGAVIEVLKHEMAHQYVHEVLGETSETPHGPAFRDASAEWHHPRPLRSMPRRRRSWHRAWTSSESAPAR